MSGLTDEQVDHEAFTAKLEDLLDGMSGAELLAIPGLYEVVSEHLNNEVLEALDPERFGEGAGEHRDEDPEDEDE